MPPIIEWLAISIVTIVVLYPLLFQNLNAQVPYHITTTAPAVRAQGSFTSDFPSLENSPRIPSPPNRPVNIYQYVFDKYSPIKQATLLYCVIHCEKPPKTWTNTTMRLIDGVASNGTYSGIIPPQKDNSTVRYLTSYKDNLGYTNHNSPSIYNVKDRYLDSFAQITTDRSIHFYTIVRDYDNDQKNVTLNYEAISTFSTALKPNYIIKQMKEITTFPPYSILYEANIPPIDAKRVSFYSTLINSKGNKENSSLNSDETSPVQFYNRIHWITTFSKVDINNQTADIKFLFYDPGVNASPGRFIVTPYFPVLSSLPLSPYVRNFPIYPTMYTAVCPTSICVGIDRIENHTVKNKFLIPLAVSLDHRALGYIAVYNSHASDTSISLTGNPSEFPFDHYSVSLRLIIPYNARNIEYSNHYDKSVNSSLVPSFDESMVNQNTCPSSTGVSLSSSNESSLCDMNPSLIKYIKPSVWLIHFDFKRNYTAAAIIVPMLAVFYLLGAIFILESTTDQLTIRLAITLGIFAFLFTFTPIINQMKPPPTVTKVPTIADSLVTVVLVATIAFSVSSVISGSPVIRNKFPEGSIWIDRIVFFFVSGIVIWYFSNYSLDITIWLVPVIIFGLGYGLLLRTSGLKIAETIERGFKGAKLLTKASEDLQQATLDGAIYEPPTKVREAAVRKGILSNKTKILAVLVTVIAVVIALAILSYIHSSTITSSNSSSLSNMKQSYKYVLYDKGDDLLGQRNYTGAITYLDKALKIDPKFKVALEDKGDALLNLRNYTGAITYVDRTLAINDTDEYALNDKGSALYDLENYTGAIIYLDKALAVDPNNYHAFINIGNALGALGNYTGAITYLDKALAINPNEESALYNKGRALNGLGNYTGAIIYLDQDLAVDPNNYHAFFYKGYALGALGNYTGAIEYFDKALALDAKDEAALYYKGKTLGALGNYTGAIEYFDKALAIDPHDVMALTSKGNALGELGNYVRAIEYFDKALAIDPHDVMALTSKGMSLDNLGNHTGAIEYFDKVLDINPHDVMALFHKALALDDLGNYTGAIEHYDKVLAIDPHYVYALNNKGFALDNLGNHTGAIEYFDKALAIDPHDASALYNKGIALGELGNYVGAVQYYDKALAINPHDVDALNNKGAALNSLGNYTGAITYLDKALAINPNEESALYNKGRALDHLGNHTQAIQYYDKALDINPKSADALNGKKQALAALNNQTTTSRTSPSNQTTTVRKPQ
jgi:tetratricopeptide (TPR) repeat protein